MQHTKPLQKRECLVASGEFYVEFYGALTGRPSKRWKGKFYISLRFRPVSILLWSLLDLDFSVSFFDFLVNFVGNLPAIFLCTFVRSQFYRGRCWDPVGLDFSVSFLDFLKIFWDDLFWISWFFMGFLGFIPAIFLCTFVSILSRSLLDLDFSVIFFCEFYFGVRSVFFGISSCYISLHFGPISIRPQSLLDLDFSVIFWISPRIRCWIS